MEGSRQGPGGRGALMALVGPTAVGKTALALELCERLGAEVLSLDSMLVYRGMDVGTAKPSAEEQERVGHHLIDLVEPHERYDVQRFLSDAEAAEARVEGARRAALYVGGTGFYLKALIAGLDPELGVDLELRASLEAAYDADAGEALWEWLESEDPASAERIHRNDRKRLVRAHEIRHLTGRRPSEVRGSWGEGAAERPHRLVGLSLEPDVLRERIGARVRAMVAGGWLDEVRAIESGPGFGPTSAQALGYPEVRAHLRGELSLEELVARVTTKTWRFSRRQLTWYRGIGEIEWVDPTAPNAIERALGALDA